LENAILKFKLRKKTREKKMIRLELPYPPSVNHYYGRNGKRTFIKAPGLRYREKIMGALWRCLTKGKNVSPEPLDGDLAVEIIIYPPDKRKRDMDNVKKALFDALQHAGLYYDDNQICDDHTIRINKVVKGGMIDFRIRSFIERPSMNDELFLNGVCL
jgi:crossover junction endodeoxyribonuclease RusA